MMKDPNNSFVIWMANVFWQIITTIYDQELQRSIKRIIITKELPLIVVQ